MGTHLVLPITGEDNVIELRLPLLSNGSLFSMCTMQESIRPEPRRRNLTCNWRSENLAFRSKVFCPCRGRESGVTAAVSFNLPDHKSGKLDLKYLHPHASVNSSIGLMPSPLFEFNAISADKGEAVKASYYHTVNPSTAVAAEMIHRFSNYENSFTIGSSHVVDTVNSFKELDTLAVAQGVHFVQNLLDAFLPL